MPSSPLTNESGPATLGERGSAATTRRLRRSGEHWTVLVGSLAALLALVLLGALLEPDPRGYGTHEKLGLKPCFPLVAWELPCPGCGVTTALAHAARGDLLASLVTQPFGLFLALAVPCFAAWTLWTHRRGRDVWVELQRGAWTRGWVAVLALLLCSWVYKAGRVRGWF